MDFRARARAIEQLEELEKLSPGARAPRLREQMAHWPDGRVKLYTARTALRFRRDRADLFGKGDYVPLPLDRAAGRSACAFARRRAGRWALTAVPLRVTKLCQAGSFPLGRACWGASALRLPRGAPTSWVNIYTGEELEARASGRSRVLRLAQVFANFPVALLAGPAERLSRRPARHARRKPSARGR